MPETLTFVTNNDHKLAEIRQILQPVFTIRGLTDLPFEGEIPETCPDIAGNALQKAHFIHDRFGINCFADDTGLEVEALDGAPGVYSARYAGEKATYSDNVNKLLAEMEGTKNRRARFITVIALILNGREHLFEGRVDGQILAFARGERGFGYDPVFEPDGSNLSFAEMEADMKNAISHRGEAVRKLAAFLQQLPK